MGRNAEFAPMGIEIVLAVFYLTLKIESVSIKKQFYKQKPMHIKLQAPGDIEYSYEYTQRLQTDNYKLAETLAERSRRRRKKSATNLWNLSAEALPKKRNSFRIPKFIQSKQKTLINLFLNKLKQGLAPRNFNSQFFDFEKSEQNTEHLKTIQWNPYFEILYSIINVLLMITAYVVLLLELAFPEINSELSVKYISSIIVLLLICEILSRIFTRSSINITHPSKSFLLIEQAWKDYVRSWFLFDVVIVIIFTSNIFITQLWLLDLKFLIFFRINTVREKIKNLQILLLKNCFWEQYWELMTIFVFNFLFAHILAVILLAMADPEQSWITQKNISQQTWITKYIWAYYWGTTIMLTVGFGDISPSNTHEALVMVFIETLSCAVLAYNINKIGGIITKITSYEAEKFSNLKVFTQMQVKNDVSDDIKKKITSYITETAELKRNYNVDEEKQLLEKLPKSLFEQLKKESTFKILVSLPFFRNLSVKSIQEISLKIEKKLTHPEEILIESHTVPDIFIVNKGHISYHMTRPGLKTHGKEIQSFKVSEKQFKILSLYFFTNKQIKYDVKCKNNTIVYYLSRSELQSLLSATPYCYEYYCMMKDKDFFNPSDLQTEACELCTPKAFHTLFNCPKLHYIPIKSMIVFKVLKKQPFKIKPLLRNQRIRIGRPKSCALKIYINEDDYWMNMGLIHKQYVQKYRNTICRPQPTLALEENFSINTYTHDFGLRKNLESKKNFLKNVSKNVFNIVEKDNESMGFCKYIVNSMLGLQTECDHAHDFPFYFELDNPSKISDRFPARFQKKKSMYIDK